MPKLWGLVVPEFDKTSRRILVLSKRQYMGKDLLNDRFGRFREIPLELARIGHKVTGICLSYRARSEGRIFDQDALAASLRRKGRQLA